ncbi:single-stranded-DNA-specific exonuclease RecJ [Limosilactobacillus sp.]|jgi:single-stranded-DNA-specific exonuclease|uniref:single-stranded-DNA-specific exonuclease RecJ n=2 Tax=Limosilactobacillus sp. TaxID=2773925 RepID=UPI0025BDB670|nr:single-stranded-DNA-specific exonuclease RecJ [Limosilactobacillus sp.]MCI2031334.1 single-stranded-DNA-specific exonuclease RecJ [Limosilactobacillus sp.]
MVKAQYDWQRIKTPDNQIVQKLSEGLSISPIIAQLLVERGITSLDEAQAFIQPSMQAIHDPHKLHDMDKAVNRIQQAIEQEERITVYGDYDADGITSTALMYEVLRDIGAKVDYYVPNRFRDGYGPNAEAYQRIIERGTTLIITVDNGVSGKAVIDPVVKQGVDVIVTDHHEMPEELPNAYAIVHPRYPGSDYPFTDLSGVGVAFKVAWALMDEFPEDFLDLVAIGEIADVVSVTDENRPLIMMGIQELRQGMRPGLHALVKEAGISEQSLTDQDIGFVIAPRLNALGRIADANQGVELLTTMDEDQASGLAKAVDQANSKRQELVAEIMSEAEEQVKQLDQSQPVLLVIGHDWHQGVLGIVASRLMDQTGKPTIVASANDDQSIAKGSGRSVDGFNLFTALDGHRDLMTSFGGHPAACGLSFDVENGEKLREVLNQEAKKQQFDGQQKQVLQIATAISPTEVNMQLYNQLVAVSPFGPGNEQPVFELSADQIADITTMGKDNSHLKFSVSQDQTKITIIAFGKGNLAPALKTAAASQVKLAVKLSVNEWRGKRTVQLMLEDISIDGPVILDQRTNKLSPRLFNEAGYYIAFDKKLRDNIQPHLPSGAALSPEEAETVDFTEQEVTLVDCPPSLTAFEKLFKADQAAPAQIRLLLFQPHSVYLSGMPVRNEFARLYRLVVGQPQIDLNRQLNRLSRQLNINAERLIFMLRVFSAAGFVTIKDGILKPVSDISKTDIKETSPYQRRVAQYQAEQVLLFSDSKALVKWILNCLSIH